MDITRETLSLLNASAFVIIVRGQDEMLDTDAVFKAAEAWAPGKVRVISPTAENFADEFAAFKASGSGVMIVPDLLATQGSAMMLRDIREFAMPPRDRRPPFPRLIMVEHSTTPIPPIIAGDVELVVPKVPSNAEVLEEVNYFLKHKDVLAKNPGLGQLTPEEKNQIVMSVSGLYRHEISRLLSNCFVTNGNNLDVKWLRENKARRIQDKSGGAVNLITNLDVPPVGGAEVLMEWLDQRRKAFASKAAADYGLPESKGVLIVGIPGTGKSLTPKYVGQTWNMPLIRVDVSKFYDKYVGNSEANCRAAIEAIEAMSPCIAWFDEIEKALGGSGEMNGGTSTRILGDILTWLNEKLKPVFVIATANQIANLPPEVVRAGRLDKRFFMDLPDAREREAIAAIHLLRMAKESNGLSAITPKMVADACEGFSGAEIWQVIADAMYVAFSMEGRPVTEADILKAASELVPLCVTMKEPIKALRDWAASGRATLANRREKPADVPMERLRVRPE